MGIRAWSGLQWPKFPTHEEAGTEIAQLHTRRASQTCQRHSISLIVQDVAPVFPQDRTEAECLQFVADGK
jgi:hypothetical protein